MDIPFDRLGISDALRARVAPDAPRAARLAAAAGLPGEDPAVELAALYVLAGDPDPAVREAAVATVQALPGLIDRLEQGTHPKVLELVATVRPDPAIDQRLVEIRNTNDRTAMLVAARADAELCSFIADHRERLLITPDLVVALHQNPACPDEVLDRAAGFLRVHRMLPDLPASRAEKPTPPAPAFDLEAEIEAALRGEVSPHLQARQKIEMFDIDKLVATAGAGLDGFRFDFQDDGEFSLDLLQDRDGATSGEERIKLEQKIAAMSPGKKIKLAYLGNKEVRSILIRDRSKMVATAVIKSGRLTDSEVLAYAGNRNLDSDVLREMAVNREWVRKYPVQVALVNNPRCPPSIAVKFVNNLQAKDLASLARNRNVSSVVFQAAVRLNRQKTGN